MNTIETTSFVDGSSTHGRAVLNPWCPFRHLEYTRGGLRTRAPLDLAISQRRRDPQQDALRAPPRRHGGSLVMEPEQKYTTPGYFRYDPAQDLGRGTDLERTTKNPA